MKITQFHLSSFLKNCVMATTVMLFFSCDTDTKTTSSHDTFGNRKNSGRFSGIFAGSPTGKAGYKDGRGSEAMFSRPLGMAMGSNDNIYIADSGNHVIRKIDVKGNVTTYAGTGKKSGFKDGNRKEALFNNPTGIVIENNIMYILDTNNHRVRKIVENKDSVTTIMGGKPGYKDNAHGPENVQFEYPRGFLKQSFSNIQYKKNDPHKKYGDHTDVTVFDGPKTKRHRIIVLKDGKVKAVETVKHDPASYQKVYYLAVLSTNGLLMLNPEKNALFIKGKSNK